MPGRLVVEQVRTSDLLIDPRNARTHPKRQIRQIASSIRAFGFVHPVLIDEANRLIALNLDASAEDPAAEIDPIWTIGGAVGALMALGALSLWALRGKRKEITNWIKANRRTLISMEVLFGVSFLVWAFVRANNPEIQFTEKPMELAFLNGILRELDRRGRASGL